MANNAASYFPQDIFGDLVKQADANLKKSNKFLTNTTNAFKDITKQLLNAGLDTIDFIPEVCESLGEISKGVAVAEAYRNHMHDINTNLKQADLKSYEGNDENKQQHIELFDQAFQEMFNDDEIIQQLKNKTAIEHFDGAELKEMVREFAEGNQFVNNYVNQHFLRNLEDDDSIQRVSKKHNLNLFAFFQIYLKTFVWKNSVWKTMVQGKFQTSARFLKNRLKCLWRSSIILTLVFLKRR